MAALLAGVNCTPTSAIALALLGTCTVSVFQSPAFKAEALCPIASPGPATRKQQRYHARIGEFFEVRRYRSTPEFDPLRHPPRIPRGPKSCFAREVSFSTDEATSRDRAQSAARPKIMLRALAQRFASGPRTIQKPTLFLADAAALLDHVLRDRALRFGGLDQGPHVVFFLAAG